MLLIPVDSADIDLNSTDGQWTHKMIFAVMPSLKCNMPFKSYSEPAGHTKCNGYS